MPLQGDSFEMEGGKLNSLMRSDMLKFKILFSLIYPTGSVVTYEFGKIELEGRAWNVVLRYVGHGLALG